MSLQEGIHGWVQKKQEQLAEKLMPTIDYEWKLGDLDPPLFNMQTGEFYGDVYQEYCEKRGEDWRNTEASLFMKARYSNYETWALTQLVFCLTLDHRLNQYGAALHTAGTREGAMEKLAFVLHGEFAGLEWIPPVKGSSHISTIVGCAVEEIYFAEVAEAIADAYEYRRGDCLERSQMNLQERPIC